MRPVIQYKALLYSVCLLLSLLVRVVGAESPNSLYGPGPERWVLSPENVVEAKRELHTRGLAIDTEADIRRAATHTSAGVRWRAMIVLVDNSKREAIPVVRQALDDANPLVRYMAARLMGILGDLSGLDRVRRDVSELSREKLREGVDAKEPHITEKNGLLSMQSTDARLGWALRGAHVLAEFGDSSGYELAAEAAVHAKPAIRVEAIQVLAELGRIDHATLRARGFDPEAILLMMAESETHPHLLDTLYCCVRTSMRPASTVKILERLEQSPHLSERQRRILMVGLNDARMQLAQENKPNERKPD